MARKKAKRKLTPDQKKWLANLQEYLKGMNWVGDQDLKEFVEGKFGVLSVREEGWPENTFDCFIGADDFAGAEAIVKYNSNAVSRIIELEACETLKEVKRSFKVTREDLLPERMK
jgi:hypothetical protein